MTAIPTIHRAPDVEKGVSYWQGVPATVDGVLGGYGNGTLPLVDAQGSRTFLLQVLPRLSAITPASAKQGPGVWMKEKIAERGGKGKSKTRALDCGAGVGRVSRDVLTRICDIVHIVEPVESFLEEAKKQSHTWPAMKLSPSQTPFQARKIIHFHLSTLQTFDPSFPFTSSVAAREKLSKKPRLSTSINDDDNDDTTKIKPLFESTFSISDKDQDMAAANVSFDEIRKEPTTYDVIWAQWCLQHLSDRDLVSFLKRSKVSLAKQSQPAEAAATTTTTTTTSTSAVLDGSGIIVVKENVLRDEEDGSEKVWYDDEDHSITRTSNAYERVFKEAGLTIVRTQLQLGLPDELFPVRMWCLRE